MFAKASHHPYNEFDAPAPESLYGKSKLAGEEFVRTLCHRYLIVRSAWVYGIGRDFVSTVLNAAADPTCPWLAVPTDRFASPTSADDLTAAVEQLCDQIELELQRQFPGCFFPFRYSPGYGDLPLTLQSSLLALLDAPRQVGLCASASHILTPRKSVTAILGVADHPIQASVRSCLGCPAHDGCQYRKSGGHCGIS